MKKDNDDGIDVIKNTRTQNKKDESFPGYFFRIIFYHIDNCGCINRMEINSNFWILILISSFFSAGSWIIV